MARKNFKDRSEQEIVALAISLEEEDSRIYGDFAEGLRESYPTTAKIFDEMKAEVENVKGVQREIDSIDRLLHPKNKKSKLREEDHKLYHDTAQQRSQESPYCDRHIYVSVKITPTQAIYSVRDEGPGFDPSTLPDPTDPVNLDRPCGRGMLLMRTFMDNVIYNDKGNEVTLFKDRDEEDEDELEVEE